MDEIDVTVDGNDFQRGVADIEVEYRLAGRDDIAERGRYLDDDILALVVQPCKPRGHIQGCGLGVEIDELDLGVLAHPQPGPIRQHELRFCVVARIEGILETERRILDRDNPVVLFFDIAQELALYMGDSTDQSELIIVPGLGRS